MPNKNSLFFSIPVNFLILIFPACVLSFKHAASGIIYFLSLFFIFSVWKGRVFFCSVFIEYKAVFFVFSIWAFLYFLRVCFQSDFVGGDFEDVFRFLSIFVIFWLLSRYADENIRYIGLSAAVGAIWSFFLALQSCSVLNVDLMSCRASNGFTNAVPFGGMVLFLGVCSLLSLRFLYFKISCVMRFVFFIGFLAGVGGSFLSQTRGSWIAIPAYLLIFLAPWRTNLNWLHFKWALGFVGAFLIVFFGFGMDDVLKARFVDAIFEVQSYYSGNVETSLGGRLAVWEAALAIWHDAPLFGVGPSGWHVVLNELAMQGVVNDYVKDFSHPHNDYLTVLAQFGLVGFVIFVSIYIVPFFYFWKFKKSVDDVVAMASHLGMALTVGFFIYSLTESMFAIKFHITFFVFFMAVFLFLLNPNRYFLRDKNIES